ncbi:cadmium-translocating P-type ATPase [bacterium]|nr:MAG: cadmium-translocating P-type ATPase [bacterium]
MDVDPEHPKGGSHPHGGKLYLFCNPKCRARFAADPEGWLSGRLDLAAVVAAEAAAAGPTTAWVCPMCPEVREPKPVPCPSCGMALEPETPGAEDDGGELADMTRRLWAAAAFGLPVMGLAMAMRAPVLQAVLAAPAVFWAGWPFFERAWVSLKTGRLNMFTLIALGTAAAYGGSLLALLVPGLTPAAFRDHHGRAPMYFEAAAMITAFVCLGQVLELRARARTKEALAALMDLAPKTARRVGPGGDEDVPLAALKAGDTLRVRPGEAVPVDGTVLEGRSAVDESLVTGEAMPVEKGPGAEVIGGALNGDGSFTMRADAVGQDTLLARVVALVAKAQRTRAPAQARADAVAARFVPAVVAAAAVAAAAWLLFGPEPRLAHALSAAVAVLVVACPCALGLATPMSVTVGVGRGARAGVLVRDAAALEELAAFDTLVLDKTGTLTEGRPVIESVSPTGDLSEAEVLRLAAAVERASQHPLAKAVLAEAARRGLSVPEASDAQLEPGRGVSGTVEGRRVFVGRPEAEGGQGRIVFAVRVDGREAGVLAAADPLKEGAGEAVEALRRLGVRLVLATGDGAGAAGPVAEALGILEVRARLLPADKAALVEQLKAAGRRVAMAGDGVNDAAALAAAHVGVAMGHGADAAKASAAVTLVHGDLAGLVRARVLGRAVTENARRNLFWAFAYNAAAVPLAAGLLYPVTGWILGPMAAGALMSLSSVTVITNALFLRDLKL